MSASDFCHLVQNSKLLGDTETPKDMEKHTCHQTIVPKSSIKNQNP